MKDWEALRIAGQADWWESPPVQGQSALSSAQTLTQKAEEKVCQTM